MASFWRLTLVAALVACSNGSSLPTVAGGNGLLLAEAQRSSGGIYVANYAANSITVFAANAHGNTRPIRTISGSSTGIAGPVHISGDRANLYVNNRTKMDVTVYSRSSKGNRKPSKMLAAGGLNSPAASVVAPNGDVFVANCAGCVGSGADAIFHFKQGAKTSDFSISGSNTGLKATTGVGIDAAGFVYAGNAFGGAITVYATHARGNASPVRTITSNHAFTNIQQLIYAAGTLYVADPAGVYLYPSAAKGSPTPSTFFSSAQIGAVYPGAIAVNGAASNPTIYVADYEGNAVVVLYTTGKPPTLKLKSKTIIKGGATKLDGPTGIWFVR